MITSPSVKGQDVFVQASSATAGTTEETMTVSTAGLQRKSDLLRRFARTGHVRGAGGHPA